MRWIRGLPTHRERGMGEGGRVGGQGCVRAAIINKHLESPKLSRFTLIPRKYQIYCQSQNSNKLLKLGGYKSFEHFSYCLPHSFLCIIIFLFFFLVLLAFCSSLFSFSKIQSILCFQGRRQLLKCLLEIHAVCREDDPWYLLNDLYITDYCVWIQKTRL